MGVVPFVASPRPGDRPKLGSILVRRAAITPEQLETALTTAVENKERLGEVLVRLAWATEETIARALAEQLELPFLDPTSADPDPAAVALLPNDLADRHCVLPIRCPDAETVVVAVADPMDDDGLADVAAAMGRRLRLVVAERSAIEYARMVATGRERGRRAQRDGRPGAEPPSLEAAVARLVVAVEEIAGELKLLRETIAPPVSAPLRTRVPRASLRPAGRPAARHAR